MLLYNICPVLFLSVIIPLFIPTSYSSSWDVSLIEQKPSLSNPSFPYLIKKGVDKRINLVGTIEAQLYTTTPSNTNQEHEEEQLRVFQSDKCVSVKNAILTIVMDGEATFHNLCMNKAGSNYQIRYTLRDEFDIILGTHVGNPFSVSVGIRYQIGVVVQPANITVGVPILNDPVVAVQDRGFNTIETVNNGTVEYIFKIDETLPFNSGNN